MWCVSTPNGFSSPGASDTTTMAAPPSPVPVLFLYGKDILGLLGAILTSIPFFKEWRLKANIQEAESPGAEGEVTLKAFTAIAVRFRQQFFSPDKGDFLLIAIGLSLISLSFLFSLLITSLS
jgi:hypothetical protein